MKLYCSDLLYFEVDDWFWDENNGLLEHIEPARLSLSLYLPLYKAVLLSTCSDYPAG